MRIIEGRAYRRGSNRLAMKFVDIDVPDLAEPRQFAEISELAEGRQSGDDGRGKTLQIMLGWRDGGPGRHTLTMADGREIKVGVEKDATVISDSGGTVLARMAAEIPTVVCGAEGAPMFTFADAVERGRLAEMTVQDASGQPVATLQVSYDEHNWKQISMARDVARAAASLGEEIRSLSGSGSSSLKLKIAGTRLLPQRQITDDELTVLFAVCVDIAIGYRRYVEAMRKP